MYALLGWLHSSWCPWIWGIFWCSLFQALVGSYCRPFHSNHQSLKFECTTWQPSCLLSWYSWWLHVIPKMCDVVQMLLVVQQHIKLLIGTVCRSCFMCHVVCIKYVMYQLWANVVNIRGQDWQVSFLCTGFQMTSGYVTTNDRQQEPPGTYVHIRTYYVREDVWNYTW